jgi:hypothetical protein
MPGQHWSEKKQCGNEIGLFRGLFWTALPALIQWSNEGGRCDCCGNESPVVATSFFFSETSNKAVKIEMTGLFRHPHSFYYVSGKNGRYSGAVSLPDSDAPILEGLGNWLVRDTEALTASKNRTVHQLPMILTDAYKTGKFSDCIIGGLIGRGGQATNVDRALFERMPITSEQDRERFCMVAKLWMDAKCVLKTALGRLEFVIKSKEGAYLTGSMSRFHHYARNWFGENLRVAKDADSVNPRPLAKECLAIFDDLAGRFYICPEKMKAVVSARESLLRLFPKEKE